MNLDGKVAVVTGSGRGIGRAYARALAEAGCAVVVNDVDAEPAHETAELITAAGGEAAVGIFDTVDLAAAKALIATTVERFGKLDILVNNAGITRDKMFHNLDDDLYDLVLDVNLKTGFHATLAAMPAKRRILIAGEMLELGKDAASLHADCGTAAAEKGIDLIIGVRGNAQHIVDAARKAGALALFLASPLEAGEWLKAELRQGDAVVLKASRGVGLEQALRVLQ